MICAPHKMPRVEGFNKAPGTKKRYLRSHGGDIAHNPWFVEPLRYNAPMHGRSIALLPLMLVLLAAAPATAEAPADEKVMVRYATYWGGLHAADVVLALSERDGRYEVVMEIGSRGLIGWLFGVSAAAHSHGVMDAGALHPRLYRYYTRDGDGEELTEVSFDPATTTGSVVRRTRDTAQAGRAGGWQQEEIPDVVPLPLRTGAFDPLSLVPVLRHEVAAAVAEGRESLTLPIYDGKRRFDVVVRIRGPSSYRLDGREIPTLEITIAPEPLAGFSRSKARRWENYLMTMQLDRSHLMPLRVLVEGRGPATVVRALDTCDAGAGCDFTLDPPARTALGE